MLFSFNVKHRKYLENPILLVFKNFTAIDNMNNGWENNKMRVSKLKTAYIFILGYTVP